MTRFTRLRNYGLTVALGLGILLAATGCVVYEERITFEAAGNGTFQLTCGVDLSAAAGLPEMLGTARDAAPEAAATPAADSNDCGKQKWSERLGPGIPLETFTEGVGDTHFDGIRLTVPFAAGSAGFNDLVAFAKQTSAGDNGRGPGAELKLTAQGGTFTLSGQIPPILDDEAAAIPLVPVMLANARRTLTLTLPGQVTAADADAREGQTYTWRLDPLSTAPRVVNVVWNPTGPTTASVNPVAPPQPTRVPSAPLPLPSVPAPVAPPAVVSPTIATRVYGQGGSFTTGRQNKGGGSADSLSGPYAVATDASGGLYVADTDNHRVLYYPSGQTTATRVYGQSGDLASAIENKGGVSANSLSSPTAVALDNAGNLYVADAGNHRALVYAAGQTTATRVYGQRGDMSRSAVNTLGASSESLNAPHGLAIDAAGGLFVADRGNARALYFPAGSTTATRVFGQRGDFSATADNDLDVSADRLEDPTALAVDAAGNLYVTDYENSRVLMYPAK